MLRTLALLPEPARFTETGVAACRTNAKRVFEAIACDNPFPAAHFPDLSFNQMVMKAVFVEAPVAQDVTSRAVGASLADFVRRVAGQREVRCLVVAARDKARADR